MNDIQIQRKTDFAAAKRLILLCAATRMRQDKRQETEALITNGLNWEFVYSLALRNRLMAPVYKNICAFSSQIPEEALDKFKSAYYLLQLQNQRRYQGLGKLLEAFNQEKIPALLYKGGALAEIIYRDIAFRPMQDFDLLVKPQDWPRIKNILLRLGYTLPPTAEVLSRSGEDHIGCGNSSGTGVEFKFNLFWLDWPDFKKASIWQEALQTKVAGKPVLIPSAEDHLLLLCLSLIRHRYQGLIWFCDINELVSFYAKEIDWAKVVNKAKQKRISTFVYYGLFLTKEIFESAIPQDVLRKLSPDYLQRRLFGYFYNIRNIINLQSISEYVYSTPGVQLLQLLLIDKLTLRPRYLLKDIAYFLRLALHLPKAKPGESMLTGSLKASLQRIKRLSLLVLKTLRRVFSISGVRAQRRNKRFARPS
ncbi:nucleotidyltransferase family protein [Candidatus Omnitrophota bacterium]